MKKIYTITLEIDQEHPEATEWEKLKDFTADEFDSTLGMMRDKRFMRKCSGKSATGATTYRVSVRNQKEDSKQ